MNLLILGMWQFGDNIEASHEIIVEIYVDIGVQLLENRGVKSLLVISLGFRPPCFGNPYLRHALTKMGNRKGPVESYSPSWNSKAIRIWSRSPLPSKFLSVPRRAYYPSLVWKRHKTVRHFKELQVGPRSFDVAQCPISDGTRLLVVWLCFFTRICLVTSFPVGSSSSNVKEFFTLVTR